MVFPFDGLESPVFPCRGCTRLVPAGVLYCCAPCADAADNGFEVHEYGILGHSKDCDGRMKKRAEQFAIQNGTEPHPLMREETPKISDVRSLFRKYIKE